MKKNIERLKNEKGITLVLLGITVSVMIIIVSVAINRITADKLIDKAKETRNDIIEFGEGKIEARLPEEYQEVEYLESDTTEVTDGKKTGQAIDTEYIMQPGDTINLKVNLFRAGDLSYGVVSNNKAASEWFGYQPARYHISGAGTQFSIIMMGRFYNLLKYIIPTGEHIINHTFGKNGTFLLDDQLIKTNDYDIVNITHSIIIFSQWDTYYNSFSAENGVRFSKFKLYSCDIVSSEGVEVRNFIPCYCKTTVTDADGKECAKGTAGLYDTVNNVFYTNQGTGEFIIGDEIQSKNKSPIYDVIFSED